METCSDESFKFLYRQLFNSSKGKLSEITGHLLFINKYRILNLIT